MKQKLIAANWKMNKTLDEALKFTKAIKKAKLKNNVIIFPSYPLIPTVQKELQKSQIIVGAQNCHHMECGAYTGEVCAPMLKSLKVPLVLLGHSERRQYFQEDNNLVNLKLHAALRSNLDIMLCVGETLSQREKDETQQIIKDQVSKGLKDVLAKNMGKISIAYEPVWAIGTGKTATPNQAQEVHAYIRHLISELYNNAIAKKIQILYGGSVTPENSSVLFKEKDIDGAFVGGASLDVEKFLKIVNT